MCVTVFVGNVSECVLAVLIPFFYLSYASRVPVPTNYNTTNNISHNGAIEIDLPFDIDNNVESSVIAHTTNARSSHLNEVVLFVCRGGNGSRDRGGLLKCEVFLGSGRKAIGGRRSNF